ncbi:hypothetical protein MSG28_013120 [Choristoneura fumiferana]|uniref:Uncharacterized protein n=1 Tax=Choristoneura fumiferana TaxID=7141 RepID=A0ACC0KSL4_CHOFU|nr:hypothetical protein MSG28_013120 [Choristoneura fumiferana]
MEGLQRTLVLTLIACLCVHTCESAKINTPRVLLPWFDKLTVNFTFEIIEGGCYTWSLSRDDIIDLEPIYEDSWGHCSRSAKVSVSKTCVPPGSVIILAEEVNSGEILRGDVSIDKISSLKVMSTTWKLYLEEAPEAFEVVAYDELGNKFSTLEGVTFEWTIANLGSNVGEDPLVTVVRARAGRLTIQDIADTLYYIKVPSTDVARLEDAISLVRGTEIGTTNIHLMSGATEVATAILTVAEPYRIRVSIRPANLVIQSEPFVIHSLVLDVNGHPLTAGDEMLVRLMVEGEANVDLVRSTENGTITDAIAQNAGHFTVTAKLYSIAGRIISKQAQRRRLLWNPWLWYLQNFMDIQLNHRGGGEEPVAWSELETASRAVSLAPTGLVTIRGIGELDVRVQLKKYSHVRALGKVLSAPPELIQVSSSGHARVGKPHQLHIALTATHPTTGEYYNFHNEPRVAELAPRSGPPPHRHPDLQLFTFTCRRKGDSRLALVASADEEQETAEFEAACAPIWLRPGHEVTVKVTLLDAIGRELLDERGPRVSWETDPKHPGIEFRAVDRLFIETHPEYAPVPVPYKYYQLVVADEQAIGWSGSLKASIPEATASIQARVVAPLKCDPSKVNIAWESETVSNIATITGGSGRYAVEAPKGSSGTADGGKLTAVVPGPGSYDLVVADQCVSGDRQHVEVHIEEVQSVEVSTSRAICVGACVPIAAIVRGVSHTQLSAGRAPEWRLSGHFTVKDGLLCGVKEGAGKVRATFGGVSSADVEVLVFPPLSVVPERARLPPGGRLQLRHAGGPPPHLAALHYKLVSHAASVEVAETRSWDSTIEILAVADIRVSVHGHPSPAVAAGDRLAVAVGATVRLKSLPRGAWQSFGDGSFEVTPNGDLKALSPGYGPSLGDEGALRLVLRTALGRPLLAPAANASAAPLPAHVRRLPDRLGDLGPIRKL